ncbi:hypothetical protein CK203_050080 [Vitis vinifera]|uniref:Uncharacterized protein n=1 Tax=Vitis vinifera TaxID=29760 RepID=A0A438H4Q7_VITVI|nr:hypothetical protein CK203_050080 [Vitis vinifera]
MNRQGIGQLARILVDQLLLPGREMQKPSLSYISLSLSDEGYAFPVEVCSRFGQALVEGDLRLVVVLWLATSCLVAWEPFIKAGNLVLQPCLCSNLGYENLVEMLDELAATLASIQEFMVGMSKSLDHCETTPPPIATVPPPIVPTTNDTRLVDQRDGIPMASFPTKVHMLDIKHYNEIGYPKIHLRLYGIVLEATRQRPDKFISSFVSCWRAKVVGMVDWPKEQDHIDMVLRTYNRGLIDVSWAFHSRISRV